jgi:hypothetical protein
VCLTVKWGYTSGFGDHWARSMVNHRPCINEKLFKHLGFEPEEMEARTV